MSIQRAIPNKQNESELLRCYSCESQAHRRGIVTRSRQTACRPPIRISARHNKPTRAEGPPNKGEPMQTQYLIFAGAIAACGILYLLLKLEGDPIDKEIEQAQQYEGKQKRIKKALEK